MPSDPERQANLLQTLGLAHAMAGNYPQAIAKFQAAIALAESNQGLLDLSILGNAINNLAFTSYQSGDLAQANTQLRRAIALWENQRSSIAADSRFKVSLLEAQLLSYNSLQKVLIEQNQPETALEISERGRSQIFLEQIAERLSPETAQRLKTEPITIQRIRALAKEQNTTLVEYSLVDTEPRFSLPGPVAATELLIWVVKPTGEVIQRTVDLRNQPQSLTELIFNTRQAVGAGGRASVRPVAGNRPLATEQLKQLHELLIAPIAADLPQQPEANVTFIPQRELFLVPFPALINSAGESLIERHTILTAPSIQSLEQTIKRWEQQPSSTTAKTRPLIVGNPTMPTILTQASASPTVLSPLAGAEAEAKAIAELFNTSALTGIQATRTAVVAQMSQASVIHLATHGLLDDFQVMGMPGAIALASDGSRAVNDGLLTAGDLLSPELRLQAELVVLSACDTGGGRVTGDGVLGLARSLGIAGASNVMVSLWKVPDAPTATLMTGFYRNWQQRGMSQAQALRQAMLELKQSDPNPLSWAGFTLIGPS